MKYKILSPTDVTEKFIVPTHWLGDLLPYPNPGHETPVQMVDEFGEKYEFCLTVRKEYPQRPYHPRPEFKRKEWRAFVVERELQAGDFIYFWLDDRRPTLRVRVRVPPREYRLGETTFIA